MVARFPSFSGIKAFYAVVETGRVKDAADLLGVSASAISHQIKKLEQELNIRLLESNAGKLQPTDAGLRYFQRIQPGLMEILHATEELRSGPGAQRVTLTLTPSFAANWLLPRMKDIYLKHPDIELNLVATTRLCDLSREHIDIAIRRGLGEWDGLHSASLFKERVVPVLSRDLAATLKGRAVTAILSSMKILVNNALPSEWDEWCQARGIAAPPAKNRFLLETFELTLQAARDGLGIALARRPLVDELLTDGDLVCPYVDDYHDAMGYYAIWRRNAELTGSAKKVLAWLLSQAQRTA
jgi:LysR family transcriptional regulator, glycine cleavage system transcriptional activator